MTTPLTISRTEFLRLTALITLGCASCEAGRGDPVHAPLLPEVATGAADASAGPRGPAPASVDGATSGDDREPQVDPSCSNAAGSLRICARVGPACEGLADECRSLGDLRPRVAQAWAECFVKARRPACRDNAMGACMRAAALSACIEPGSVAQCRSIMKQCATAGRTPAYSLEECAKIISAVMPSRDPNGWQQVDAARLGPSGEDGCSLRQVLPYQPWGPSWDGTLDKPRRRRP